MLAIFIFLLLGEVACRFYYQVVHKVPFLNSPIEYQDKVLGWKPEEAFGDASSEKIKILIVGDSFTEAPGIPEEKTYYQVMARELDVEVFAAAKVGYGTLQEYLLIDRYMNQIDPDLVLIQVCSNDFINNHLRLEEKSYFNRVPYVRPYLIKGQISYHYPGFWGDMTLFTSNYSRLFYFLMKRVEKAAALLSKLGGIQSSEDEIAQKGLAFEPYRESVETTAQILKMIQSKVSPRRLVGFVGDDYFPIQEYRRIFKELGIPFLEDVNQAIKAAQKQGDEPKLDDQVHWNEHGHRIVGKVLAEQLKPFIRSK